MFSLQISLFLCQNVSKPLNQCNQIACRPLLRSSVALLRCRPVYQIVGVDLRYNLYLSSYYILLYYCVIVFLCIIIIILLHVSQYSSYYFVDSSMRTNAKHLLYFCFYLYLLYLLVNLRNLICQYQMTVIINFFFGYIFGNYIYNFLVDLHTLT